MKKRILPQLDNKERQLLYPDNSKYSGDLTDLDISLLYVILRNFNTICPQKNGWGNNPEDNDRSISANIDRIRIMKNNYVSHSSNRTLQETEFLIKWKEIRQCIIELGGNLYSERIDHMLTSEINPVIENELCITLEKLKESDRERERMTIRLDEKEKKEYIRHMFLMVLLFIILKNISGNIKCRQTSCRKYPCLNSILYLLWQSGDIEVNPGPANSTTYRNWLYEICSIVRKAIAGVPAECKMCNIWKKIPENWPHGELYFDPRNSKGLTVNKVEDFLQILIRCCDGSSKLSHEITSEIDTWNKNRSKDNEQLLYLYRTRECLKSTEQVDRSLKVLQRHLLPGENLAVEVNSCIRISLCCQPAIHQKLNTHTIYRAEATRKIASYLCIILHGKDPEGKCDNIWTKTPDGWPTDCRYYNPNNGGKRCAKNEDAMLVEALITLCKQKSIILPRPHQDMVEAWRADDQTLLTKLLTRHTAETDLKKAVMKLHEEGLLQDPEVDKHLREIGLLVQCDGSTHNVKSQSEDEDAVDTTLKELLPGCSFGQLIENQSDSPLLDKISQNIPDFLGDEADGVQFHWT
ncbi:Hypothetical predicted protein [Mytilus galloprovincialis]|uniref:DZIP3-like HEPN domain-containing protein n=1 Tax=Mytilus galloprovincialis TaxID=29158 RepID=A0A8B6G8T8_MYTGA|nr:Hypothetical predicted protein [Mytilus galloprovincialis]